MTNLTNGNSRPPEVLHWHLDQFGGQSTEPEVGERQRHIALPREHRRPAFSKAAIPTAEHDYRRMRFRRGRAEECPYRATFSDRPAVYNHLLHEANIVSFTRG
jgi:hypothetical protein